MGRIPLPENEQQLWSQHKYSVLARDPNIYKQIGKEVSVKNINFAGLANLLAGLLRTPPGRGGIRNAAQHMWGYVSDDPVPGKTNVNSWSLPRLLQETQRRAKTMNVSYLLNSTALGELMAWLPGVLPATYDMHNGGSAIPGGSDPSIFIQDQV